MEQGILRIILDINEGKSVLDDIHTAITSRSKIIKFFHHEQIAEYIFTKSDLKSSELVELIGNSKVDFMMMKFNMSEDTFQYAFYEDEVFMVRDTTYVNGVIEYNTPSDLVSFIIANDYTNSSKLNELKSEEDILNDLKSKNYFIHLNGNIVDDLITHITFIKSNFG